MNDTVAAVVIEPMIQGAAGMKLWPRGLLRELRQMCDETGALLIADEVMTGFGRTGKMFACEHEGVVPDLMAVAKGLTGGYLPLAATLTTEEIFNAFLGEYSEFKTFFHGHSYTGNQLGCAAALANLQVFEEERTLEKLSALSAQLSAGLERIRTLPHVAEVRQIGFIAAVELGPYALTDRVGHKVCLEMRKRGVLTRPLGNVVPIMPPYCITNAQLDRVLTVLAESIREVVELTAGDYDSSTGSSRTVLSSDRDGDRGRTRHVYSSGARTAQSHCRRLSARRVDVLRPNCRFRLFPGGNTGPSDS